MKNFFCYRLKMKKKSHYLHFIELPSSLLTHGLTITKLNNPWNTAIAAHFWVSIHVRIWLYWNNSISLSPQLIQSASLSFIHQSLCPCFGEWNTIKFDIAAGPLNKAEHQQRKDFCLGLRIAYIPTGLILKWNYHV